MTEVDCIFAGILGGVIGSGMILFTAHFHWKSMTREYDEAKKHFDNSLKIIEIQDRLTTVEKHLHSFELTEEEFHEKYG